MLVVVSGSGGGDASDGDRAWRMRRRGDQSGESTKVVVAPWAHLLR